jgi:hypothetical protein
MLPWNDSAGWRSMPVIHVAATIRMAAMLAAVANHRSSERHPRDIRAAARDGAERCHRPQHSLTGVAAATAR